MRLLILLPLLFAALVGRSQGDPCDSVDVYNVSFAPFSDSLIIVNVANTSSDIFSYPGFILLNANGDTVAVENVNFFGIADSSTHLLEIRPGMPDSTDFLGTLELWTGFTQTMACSWNMNFALCPPGPCNPIEIAVANFGGAIATGTFTWEISDSNGVAVDTGTLLLDDTTQFAVGYACLASGQYSMELDMPTQPMGQVWLSVASPLGGPLAVQQLFQQGNTVSDFTLFANCFEEDSTSNPPDTTGIGTSAGPATNMVNLIAHDGTITLTHQDDLPLGQVAIYDLTGRQLSIERFATSRATLDLQMLPKGVYIARIEESAIQFIR